MALISYKANFIEYFSAEGEILPDVYQVKNAYTRPKDSFVISRGKDGNAISVYGSDVWDFRQYRLAGDTGSARMHFAGMQKDLKDEVKWLMFLLIYIVDSGRATGLSISSLMNYLKALRRLSSYAEERNISVKSILENEVQLVDFISILDTRNLLRSISVFISHLVSIGQEVSGYRVFSYTKYELVNKKLSTLGMDEQHPVIPPRLFAELINQLNLLLDDLDKHIDKLQSFILAILKNEQFARSNPMQRKLGYMSKDFEPHFPQAAEIYELDALFYRYDVKNIPSFMAFLTKIQHGCRIMMHIYTGMRNSEVLSLKINSLKATEVNGVSFYRFVGDTSKFIGQKKSVSWVTSKDVLNAYKVAEMLAKIIGEHVNQAIEQVPLFISPAYLGLLNKFEFDENHVKLAHASSKLQEVYSFLNFNRFTITDEDISHLEKVNPFRAWEAENSFAVGSIWRFTTHQFRRSLAFYVAQSSLVSLPSLKRQLKHIGREMTLYYCQTKQLEADFDNADHISRLMQREKPLADATAYLYQVLLSDEPLHGSHGQFVEKNVKAEYADFLLKSKRDDLIRQFKKGEIAYKETPLGACTTIEPCDKKALREIAACVCCDRAVIKPTKLNKVIERQELFVSELKALNPEGVEYRSEKSELEVLKRFRSKVIERKS